MRIALQLITEGGTRLRVPLASLNTADPPITPTFFNPAARLNRDISVALTEVTGGTTFCDALCGIGSRGVRIAKEVPRRTEVSFVDFNEDSLLLARRNAALNGVLGRCTFIHDETNRFLHSRFQRDQKYDYIDVDPFGTPAPFMQAAFGAAADGAIVSITATDTAVLCGVYPEVAMRRYSAVPLKSEFKHEVGARILVNASRRAGAVRDLGIEPVLAHTTRHYFRVYLRVVLGAHAADRSLRNEGFIIACRECKQVESSPTPRERCARCGSLVKSTGPLWVGPLVDERILGKAVLACGRRGFTEARRLLSSLSGLNEFPPYSYSVDRITAEVKVPGVSDSQVSANLAMNGRKSMRTPFEREGLKTDADYSEVVAAVREISGGPLHPIHT